MQFTHRFLIACALATAAAASGAADDDPLATEQAQFSYGIGLQVTQSLLRQGVELDAAAFALAMQDVLAGRKPRLSPERLAAVMQANERKTAERVRARAKEALARGRKFLEDNRTRPGVQVLASGLQYKVIKQGDGPTPTRDDVVRVHYSGKLLDGREFDSSYRRGKPVTLPVAGVIKGWQEALTLMPVGSHWQIWVPSELAYGVRGAGSTIGPNETLMFDIELLGIEKGAGS